MYDGQHQHSENMIIYANNNSYKYIDPNGQDWFLVLGGGLALVGVGAQEYMDYKANSHPNHLPVRNSQPPGSSNICTAQYPNGIPTGSMSTVNGPKEGQETPEPLDENDDMDVPDQLKAQPETSEPVNAP
jgi:hypothetical protein